MQKAASKALHSTNLSQSLQTSGCKLRIWNICFTLLMRMGLKCIPNNMGEARIVCLQPEWLFVWAGFMTRGHSLDIYEASNLSACTVCYLQFSVVNNIKEQKRKRRNVRMRHELSETPSSSFKSKNSQSPLFNTCVNRLHWENAFPHYGIDSSFITYF